MAEQTKKQVGREPIPFLFSLALANEVARIDREAKQTRAAIRAEAAARGRGQRLLIELVPDPKEDKSE